MRVHHQRSGIKAGIVVWAFGFFAVVAIALCLPGCSLVSGTLRIEYDFPEGPQQSDSTSVAELKVELNDNQDFKDNKDKIKNVDEVGFVFRARNLLGKTAQGVIYLSKTPIRPLKPATIRLSPLATRVVQGVALQSGYTSIDYDASLALEVNQSVLHDAVKDGTFYLYGIADEADFDITIDELTAVVVVTAEL